MRNWNVTIHAADESTRLETWDYLRMIYAHALGLPSRAGLLRGSFVRQVKHFEGSVGYTEFCTSWTYRMIDQESMNIEYRTKPDQIQSFFARVRHMQDLATFDDDFEDTDGTND